MAWWDPARVGNHGAEIALTAHDAAAEKAVAEKARAKKARAERYGTQGTPQARQ
jgi:hypothetical protein